MGLNRNSTGGPDGMTTGTFFQEEWDIVGDVFYRMVKTFHYGVELPRFITYANMILLPKKANINIFF